METQTFREIIGFSNKKFYWGSVMMLFTALLISDWILGIVNILNIYLNASKEDYLILQRVLFSSSISAGTVFSCLFFSILLGLFYRFISNGLLAVLLTFAVFIPVNAAIEFLSLYSSGSPTFSFINILYVIFAATSFVWIFVCLSLVYLILKKQLPTIVLGGVAGYVLTFAVSLIINFISSSIYPALASNNPGTNFSTVLIRFVAFLAAGLIFGGGWYLLLRLADEKKADDQSPYISKKKFIGNIAAAVFAAPIIIFSFAISFVNSVNFPTGSYSSPVLLLLLGIAISIAGAITFYIFVYRIWDSIKDGQTRTSPGFAVGGLFIPFYNFYWIFQVLPGFAADFNKYKTQRRINTPPLKNTLLMTFAGMTVASIVPLLGILCVVVNGFVVLPMISQALDTVNSAKEAQTA